MACGLRRFASRRRRVWRGHAHAGDKCHAQGTVESAIAAAVEPMAGIDLRPEAWRRRPADPAGVAPRINGDSCGRRSDPSGWSRRPRRALELIRAVICLVFAVSF